MNEKFHVLAQQIAYKFLPRVDHKKNRARHFADVKKRREIIRMISHELQKAWDSGYAAARTNGSTNKKDEEQLQGVGSTASRDRGDEDNHQSGTNGRDR